jgi:hypothetical protein
MQLHSLSSSFLRIFPSVRVLVNNANRFDELAQRLVLNIRQSKCRRSSNLDSSWSRRPLVTSSDTNNSDQQTIAIFRGTNSFARLCVNHRDKIWYYGQHFLKAIILDFESSNVLILEWDLDAAFKLGRESGLIGLYDDFAVDVTVAQCSVYTDDFAFEDDFCGFGTTDFVDDAFGYGVDAVALTGRCDCSTNTPG